MKTRNWKWGNWKKARCISLGVLLMQSSNVMSKSMFIHAVTERSSLPAWQLTPKGYATALHHDLQASSMYVLHFWQLVSFLEVCWICGLFIFCSKESFEASSCNCLHGYEHTYVCLTYICLSHIQHYYLKQHVPFKNRSWQNARLQSFFSRYTHRLCRGYDVGMTQCVKM